MNVYFVSAKKLEDDDYQFVSFNRSKRRRGHAPLDVGIALHSASDFAMDEGDARSAVEHLERLGYECLVTKHLVGEDGVDLDGILFEKETIPSLLKLDLRGRGRQS